MESRMNARFLSSILTRIDLERGYEERAAAVVAAAAGTCTCIHAYGMILLLHQSLLRTTKIINLQHERVTMFVCHQHYHLLLITSCCAPAAVFTSHTFEDVVEVVHLGIHVLLRAGSREVSGHEHVKVEGCCCCAYVRANERGFGCSCAGSILAFALRQYLQELLQMGSLDSTIVCILHNTCC